MRFDWGKRKKGERKKHTSLGREGWRDKARTERGWEVVNLKGESGSLLSSKEKIFPSSVPKYNLSCSSL